MAGRRHFTVGNARDAERLSASALSEMPDHPAQLMVSGFRRLLQQSGLHLKSLGKAKGGAADEAMDYVQQSNERLSSLIGIVTPLLEQPGFDPSIFKVLKEVDLPAEDVAEERSSKRSSKKRRPRPDPERIGHEEPLALMLAAVGTRNAMLVDVVLDVLQTLLAHIVADMNNVCCHKVFEIVAEIVVGHTRSPLAAPSPSVARKSRKANASQQMLLGTEFHPVALDIVVRTVSAASRGLLDASVVLLSRVCFGAYALAPTSATKLALKQVARILASRAEDFHVYHPSTRMTVSESERAQGEGAAMHDFCHSLVVDALREAQASSQIKSVQRYLDGVTEWSAIHLHVPLVGASAFRSVHHHNVFIFVHALLEAAILPESPANLSSLPNALAMEALGAMCAATGTFLRSDRLTTCLMRRVALPAVLRCMMTSTYNTFYHAVDAFAALVASYHSSMRKELAAAFGSMVVGIVEQHHYPAKWKSRLLVAMRHLADEPDFMVELFFNLDCVGMPVVLFYERLTAALSAIVSTDAAVSSLLSVPKDSFASNVFLPKDAAAAAREADDSLILMAFDLQAKLATVFMQYLEKNHMDLDGEVDVEVAQHENNVARSKAYYALVHAFNTTEKPRKVVAQFVAEAFIDALAAEPIATFLLGNGDLDKVALGEYLGDGDDLCVAVLDAFVGRLDMRGMRFDNALRYLLRQFRLPGEAQKIARVLEAFSKRYMACNDGEQTFADGDACYIMAYSVIMLNTDAHNDGVKKKMTKEQFIRNNRGCNGGSDFAASFLEELYDSISQNEIKMDEGSDAVPSPSKEELQDTHDEEEQKRRQLVRERYAVAEARKATRKAIDKVIGAPIGPRTWYRPRTSEVVQVLLEHCVPAFRRDFDCVLAANANPKAIVKALRGVYATIYTTCVFRQPSMRDFVRTLARFEYVQSLELRDAASRPSDDVLQRTLQTEAYMDFSSWVPEIVSLVDTAASGGKDGGDDDEHSKSGAAQQAMFALQQIEDVVNCCIVNEGNIDHANGLRNVQNLFTGNPPPPIVKPGRRYLADVPLTKVCSNGMLKRYQFFLFSDALLYASAVSRSKWRMNRMLELKDCTFTDVADTKKHQHLVEVRSSLKNFSVMAASPEAKMRFLKAVTEAQAELRQSERFQKERKSRRDRAATVAASRPSDRDANGEAAAAAAAATAAAASAAAAAAAAAAAGNSNSDTLKVSVNKDDAARVAASPLGSPIASPTPSPTPSGSSPEAKTDPRSPTPETPSEKERSSRSKDKSRKEKRSGRSKKSRAKRRERRAEEKEKEAKAEKREPIVVRVVDSAPPVPADATPAELRDALELAYAEIHALKTAHMDANAAVEDSTRNMADMHQGATELVQANELLEEENRKLKKLARAAAAELQTAGRDRELLEERIQDLTLAVGEQEEKLLAATGRAERAEHQVAALRAQVAALTAARANGDGSGGGTAAVDASPGRGGSETDRALVNELITIKMRKAEAQTERDELAEQVTQLTNELAFLREQVAHSDGPAGDDDDAHSSGDDLQRRDGGWVVEHLAVEEM